MAAPLDPSGIRPLFPALARRRGDRPVVYFDGPAGSQVPSPVLEAMTGYLSSSNANGGGLFETSRESDARLDAAHRAVADFLGTQDPGTVVFGANMTTQTLALARSLTRTLTKGDEIVVTQLEHDANYTPWAQAARDSGATLREVRLRPEDGTLDFDDLNAKLTDRTRWVAVTAASNALGTLVPIERVVRAAHERGARVFVDAVHFAPHRKIDVEAWGCDFLACSAYKFFGPHVGILWGRRELLETLPVYKLRPSPDELPGRWMTGTQNHEGIVGTHAAVSYLAGLGDGWSDAFEAIRLHEQSLARRLLEGLNRIPAMRVHGIADVARLDERVATFSLTHESRSPEEIARNLGERGIFVWHGNYYALPVTRALGLEPAGMVRIGLLHYNTADEVDRLLGVLEDLD